MNCATLSSASCSRGPTGLFPAGYNNGYQFFQTETHLFILQEMIHEARVIPLGGQPHAGARVRSWLGDSRGHWEGDTLVVDTTNFNDRGWMTTHVGSGRLRGVPYSEALHLVERFRKVDANTIIYEMTVEDSGAYAREAQSGIIGPCAPHTPSSSPLPRCSVFS